MATITPSYAAKATITCAVHTTPLASSSSFAIGRESTEIDNSTNKYDDAMVEGKVTVGTTPTANTEIQIWIYASFHTAMATNAVDVLDGTDSDETISSAGVRGSALRLGASIDVDSATSNRTYWFVPFSVAQLFGGHMPKFWGIFVTHNTAVALNSTGSNHEFSFTGVMYDVV